MPAGNNKSAASGKTPRTGAQKSGARRGRPPKEGGAKRNNPAYRAWSGLVLRDAITEAEIRLLQERLHKEREPRDMGDLISDLLMEWARRPARKKPK